MYRRVVALAIMLIVFILGTGYTQDAAPMSFSVAPRLEVPIGPALNSYGGAVPYSVGAGAELAATFDLGQPAGLFAAGSLGYSFLPVADGDLAVTDDLSVVGLAGSIGYAIRVGRAERLSFELSTGGGVYQAFLGDSAASNFLASASAGSRFDVTPSFSLGASARFSRYFSPGDEGLPAYLYDGVSVGVSGSYNIGAGDRRSLIEVIDVRIDPVYPILYGYYEGNPVGAITIRNDERRAIENLSVEFFVPQYMNRPQRSPIVASVERGATVEVPLFALFIDEILEVTEDGKRVSAEVRISYQVRGDELGASSDATAVVQNRNALTWTDDRKAAAFVTAKDNAILRLAKQVAGVVRDQSSTALDDNFRTAVGIYETLNTIGMQYVIDPDSSYIELSDKESAQDYVQFPAQTLDYRAGDCDDLSILYAALLQSVNIDAAFITIPGHIYTAFALNLTPDEAERTFSGNDRFFVIDDRVWIPVEATIMDQGFLQAWEVGIRQWKEHDPSGDAGFFPIESAWQTFAPVASPLAEPEISIPSPNRIARSFQNRLTAVVERELADRVTRLERQIRESDGNPAIVNRLGVLYARYGLLDQAMDRFADLADRRQYGPAMINVANIHFLRGNYARALSYYERAAEVLDEDPTAVLGIARAQYELENYSEAERVFTRVASVEPELAGRFPHLSSATDSSSRASAAAVRGPAIWED